MQNRSLRTLPSNHRENKVLSLILCSRNDNYLGNSLWRLQTALNYTAKNIYQIGRQKYVEIIVTDWGSEIPLGKVLQLSPETSKIVTFVTVPTTITLKLQRDSPFSEVHALNAAVRRANGKYIGRIDQDSLVGKRFIRAFFELLEGTRKLNVSLERALFFSNRRSIPYRFISHCPSFWEIDRFIRWFGPILRVENHLKNKPHLFYCSYVGIWLLHRSLWHECGGYDERLIYMNEMESDMAARLMKRYKMVDLGKIVNYDFYHLSHYHPRATARADAHRKVNPKRWHEVDLAYKPNEIHPNSQHWGLIDYTLDIATYATEACEFASTNGNHRVEQWLFFTISLITAGVQIIWDTFFMALTWLGHFFFRFYSLWSHRSRLAWETVCGESFFDWPRLLRKLWNERKSAQIQK